MRRSIQDLLESVELRSEAFATPQEFLASQRPTARLPRSRRQTSGMSGLDFQRELAEAGVDFRSSSSPGMAMSRCQFKP
jgi:FixJ family two-component response regulator